MSAGHVTGLNTLGPNYQATFSPTESSELLSQTAPATSIVMEGKDALAPLLLLSYNAQVSSFCSATFLKNEYCTPQLTSQGYVVAYIQLHLQ